MSEPDARVEIDVTVNSPRRREGESATPEPAEALEEVVVERRATSDYKSYPTTNFPPGKTIGEIKRSLWDKFDLRENMIPLVNANKVGDSYVTKPGDQVMFQPAPKDRGDKKK